MILGPARRPEARGIRSHHRTLEQPSKREIQLTGSARVMLRRTMARSDLERCSWCGDNPLYLDYHDREWGVPLRGDRALFELLTLEGAQAGLSWITILKKRDGYRAAFARFDPETIARYTARDVRRLLSDAGIVRNRLKVESTIANAKAVLALEEQGETLSSIVWQFVDGKPIQNRWRRVADLPAETPLSKAMSKELKLRGFRFVGPTTCYAFMQAAGLVNDHVQACYRHAPVRRLTP